MRDQNELTVFDIRELYNALMDELTAHMYQMWGQYGGKFIEIGHEMFMLHHDAMILIEPHELYHYIDLRQWTFSFSKTMFLCECLI